MEIGKICFRESKNYELVAFHLRSGVDPNYQHPEFMTTFLLEAIRKEQFEIAELLLKNGADPNAKEIWGEDAPLSLAQSKGNQKMVELIQSFQ